MVSDTSELLKKLSMLTATVLDNFLFNKGFYITNRGYKKGKNCFGTRTLPVVYYLFKASQVLSNFATKADEDLPVQTIYVTEKLKIVNTAFRMASFI